jgi:hypothetical protein
VNFKKIKNKLTSLAGLGLVLLSLAPTGAVQAKDSSHTGAAYLQVELDPGGHRIQSNVSYSPIGNAWFGQDVTKSPEWMAEKISWSPESWKFTGALLDSGSVDQAVASVGNIKTFTTGKYWSPTKTAESFKTETAPMENTETGRGNLALTFPGWAAADRVFVLNKDGTHSKGIDRNADDTSSEFSRIDSKNAATAAGRVNDNLVAELNRALEDNYGQLVTNKGKRNPDLSTEGFMNLLWATVGGKFPDTGKTWTYNEVDYSIDTSGSVPIKSVLAKDVWNKKSSTDKLLQIYPNRKGAVKSDAYTYAVPKGYHAGVGSGSTVDSGGKRGSDLYAITWFDIAMGATSATVRAEKQETDDSNSTVVGEQVDNWFYKALSALVSTLGVRNADELVFGEWGNLFKNNTFPMFMAVQTPFIILAFMILSVAVVNAIRRSTKDYLSVGDVRSLQDVFGQAINAVLMIIFLNVILFGAIYLNGALVKMAAQMSHFMKTMQTTGAASGDNAVSSFFANLLGFSGITSILVSFVLIGINIKFTWRYVARAISFGIYFVIAPVVFALDALKGDGRLLNFGSGTANIMKNLIGLVFQQALDALGIAFAINVGRIIFGNGVIVTILGFLSIEAITNALMGMFGVQAGSIRGIAEAGQTWHQKGVEGLKRAGAFLGGAMAAKGYAAVKSGRNRDDEAILRKKHEVANTGGVPSGSNKGKSNIKNSLDQEAQVAAYRANEFGEGKQKAPGTTNIDKEVKPESNWDTLKGEYNDLKDATKEKAQGAYDGVVATDWGGALASGSSKLFGAFTEGATNRGIHGDPNTTVDKATRISGMDSRLNLKNYDIDSNGNVVAKGIKGRMQRAGRDVGRFLGGATLGMVSDPKYGARTLLGAAAGGLSAVTPGRFDDMVATVANIQNYESALTGGNTHSFGSRFAKSWVGRMAGAQGMNWDVQNVSAQSMFEPPSQAGYTVAGITGESSEGVSMYTSPVHDDTEEMVLRTSWGEGEGNKEQRDVHSAMSELSSFESNPNGNHSFSREQLTEMTGDAVKGQYAQQVLNYMDKSGMSNIHFEHGQVAVDQQMVRDAGTFVKEDDPKAHSALAVAKAKYGEGGLYHDHETGAVIKQSLDSGKPMAFVPKSFADGGNNYALKQREMDIQNLRKSKMDESKRLELTKKAFSVSPSEYQDFRQTHFTKELNLDGDKK